MNRLRIRNETLYRCFISMLFFAYMMEASSWKGFTESIFHNIIQTATLLMAFLCVISKKHTPKELLHFIVLNSIGVICFISSGYTGLFMTMLAVTLLPINSLNSIMNMMLKEGIIVFGGIIFASQIGVLPNVVLDIDKHSYVTTAVSLGFNHPNMLAVQATSLALLFLCVNREEIKKRYIVSTLIIIGIFFCFSQGRASLILGISGVILIAFHKSPYIKRNLFRILPWTYIIVLVVLFVCMEIYDQLGETAPFVKILNDSLFNGRIGLAYRSLKAYPVTLFGKALDMSIWNEWQYYSLDNGQVMVLLEYGIVGFIAYFGLIQMILKKIEQSKETIFAIIMIIFLIWSMYEGTMYFLGKNFAFLFIGASEFKQVAILKEDRQEGKCYDS